MEYFDVHYITPSGLPGCAYNIPAENPFDAGKFTACSLSFNTPWHPIEWKIIDVQPASDKTFVPSEQN